jgi:hypothetical protein
MEPKQKIRLKKKGKVLINGAIGAEMLDLSTEGMYIYTNADFIPESIINLSFSLGAKRLNIYAKVRHMEPGIGIGVKFIDIDKDAAETIKNYIDKIREGR